MKFTTVSPANIAFIKYWGRSDHQLFIPKNDNISMTMSGCQTRTTVELTESPEDSISVKFYQQQYQILTPETRKAKALYRQIDRIRSLAQSHQKVKIMSENNFPADAGIASSASSFSALTACLLLVYGLKDKFIDKEEFSRQIRLCGSGSAVRSAMGGFVELLAGTDHQSSHAVQIADETHWDLVDIVAVVDPEKKEISSSLGHELADSSPYYQARIRELPSRIQQCREAIIHKDIEKLGDATEKDAISMHTVMMTSEPPAFYWAPGPVSLIHEIRSWRKNDGLQAYYTFDAGANAHVICEKKDAPEVQLRLKSNPFVKWTIFNEPCPGTMATDKHLF